MGIDDRQDRQNLLSEIREDIRIAKVLGTGVDVSALENTCKNLEAELSGYEVVDPQRVADGYYGRTFHDTKEEAEARVEAFSGSYIVGGA